MLLTPLLHAGEIWNAYLMMPPDGASSGSAILEFESITGSKGKGRRLSRAAPGSLMDALRRGAALDREHLLRELSNAADEA